MKNAVWIFSATAIVAIFFFPAYMGLVDLRKKNAEYRADIARLEQEYRELLEEKRKLEDDPIYLEKVAREKMGLARDGEIIYKIVPAETKSKTKKIPQ